MVKPQFEVGRDQVGDGVVREPALRATAVRGVVDAALGLGLSLEGIAASALPGPSGNVEYFTWFRRGHGDGLMVDAIDAAIARAIEEGPR